MAKLVQKSGYIQAGHASSYLKYIASREGVEKLRGNASATPAQEKLIKQILNDFPDASDLFEYEDYIKMPTIESASEFISMALDANVQDIHSGNIYMNYIATRPKVEKHGNHGLFGVEDSINLEKALSQLDERSGNVWTIIYSLRREDAERLGYDSAQSWRNLLLSNESTFANALGIPHESLMWYAAFHNEGHHPHIHMMLWNRGERKGFLTKDGIYKMRSCMTNTIFQDELHDLYVSKNIAYSDLTAAAQKTMHSLIHQMNQRLCLNPSIQFSMESLAKELCARPGKKQYGYLSKPLKKLVDTIVDELEQEAEVAQCYETWNALRDQLGGYYSQAEREHSPLSQQKEFRRIKNIVIAEAMNMQLGIPTFEDDEMDDEPEPKFNCTREEKVAFENAQVFRRAKEILYNPDINVDDKTASIRALEKLYDSGYPVAAHLLGKLYRDGVFVQQDLDVAEHWFRCSAIAGNDYSQYALGKLLLKARPQEALQWLSAAAEQNNQFAHYTLGKMYLVGEAVSKDTLLALSHLLSSADQGNQYAQYTLGKIYLQGTGVERNREAARKWFEKSAAQGNQYAQFFLEHFKVIKSPSTFLCTTRLLHHMSKIFRDNSQPPANPAGMRIDSKRRKKLQEKRIALGHKPDDHEEYSFNMHMHM